MWQGTRDLNHLDLLYPAAMSCSLSPLPAVLADSQLHSLHPYSGASVSLLIPVRHSHCSWAQGRRTETSAP